MFESIKIKTDKVENRTEAKGIEHLSSEVAKNIIKNYKAHTKSYVPISTSFRNLALLIRRLEGESFLKGSVASLSNLSWKMFSVPATAARTKLKYPVLYYENGETACVEKIWVIRWCEYNVDEIDFWDAIKIFAKTSSVNIFLEADIHFYHEAVLLYLDSTHSL